MSAAMDAGPPAQGSDDCGGEAHRSVLLAALEAAFDYRGDVTLALRDGTHVIGYLSNRDFRGPGAFVDMLSAGAEKPRRVLVDAIAGVELTGRDTASGKSWETWLKQYKAKLEAEARGEKVNAIGLFPESLEA